MYIIQITDTHIVADPATTFDGVDTAASLQSVIAAINRLDPQPDLMLLTGDLVHEPGPGAYRRLRALLEPLAAPIYAIPGNHDVPQLMRTELPAPVYHDKTVESGGWRILLLDSWLPNEHAGQLSNAELEWLDRALAADSETPVLIALHHPPVSIGSPWMDAMGLRNADDFLAIIDRHDQVRAVIWGHIHQVFEAERKGVRLLACPSTCVQFRPGSEEYEKDTLPPGYRWLRLLPDGILRTGIERIEM